MHTPLVVMPLLCGWNYAGYLGDPPDPRPAPAARRVAAAPTSPPACGCTRPRCQAPSKADRVASAAQAPPAIKPAGSRPAAPAEQTPATGPKRWRLADAHGQTWEHDDPAVLSRWVAERNAALAGAPRVYRYGAAVTCPGGRCP